MDNRKFKVEYRTFTLSFQGFDGRPTLFDDIFEEKTESWKSYRKIHITCNQLSTNKSKKTILFYSRHIP